MQKLRCLINSLWPRGHRVVGCVETRLTRVLWIQRITSPFTKKQVKVCRKRKGSICPDHCGLRTETAWDKLGDVRTVKGYCGKRARADGWCWDQGNGSLM